MIPSFRQSMAWLHTWAGLLPGWIVFLVFLFGTASFFEREISGWMRPEVQNAGTSSQALDAANALLEKKAANAESWAIFLPEDRGGDALRVVWIPSGGSWAEHQEVRLDPATGRELVVRDTEGGSFLYRFHFDLHGMPRKWANYIVLIASLAILVAILSGIVTHKKIFSDFFILRFGKGQRSWLDTHNVTGVLALPFHLMITYTGFATLLFTLMPWAISANFRDREAFFDAAFPHPHLEASGIPAPVVSLKNLMARIRKMDDSFVPAGFSIEHPGDANALVEVRSRYDKLPSNRSRFYLNGATGEVIQTPYARGPAPNVASAMVDLHAGSFSGPVLRWLYFFAGLGGTVMIGSGLVLWTVKRRAKLSDPARAHFGFRLVERLNIGVIAGASAGIAVYFLANRLLPLDLAGRANWEINSLFIAWGAIFVWTLARSARRAWVETLVACAALYALIPVVNALTTTRGLVPSVTARDWAFAGFDGMMLATAAACTFAAWKIAAHKPKPAPRSKDHGRVEVAK